MLRIEREAMCMEMNKLIEENQLFAQELMNHRDLVDNSVWEVENLKQQFAEQERKTNEMESAKEEAEKRFLEVQAQLEGA